MDWVAVGTLIARKGALEQGAHMRKDQKNASGENMSLSWRTNNILTSLAFKG